jgi:hydrogenase maturation protease
VNKHNKKESILILGIGNVLLSDEGFGVYVVRRLQQAKLPDNVAVGEGGIGGFNLLGQLEGVDKLLVVDVMWMNTPPGELHIIYPEQELKEPGKQIVSFHQIGVLELVELSKLIGNNPEVTYLVTRPEKLNWSTELSPALQNAVDKAVDTIIKICKEYNSEIEKGAKYYASC